jgi:hypothetical protein
MLSPSNRAARHSSPVQGRLYELLVQDERLNAATSSRVRLRI